MAGLHDGFAGHRVASEAELDDALAHGTVVVDANVLLDLYRYTRSTSDDLLRVLETVGERLWVPHQVVAEFWRNRLSAMAAPESAARDARAGLTKAQSTAEHAIRTWAKAAAPTEQQVADLIRRVGETIAAVSGEIDAALPARRPSSTPTDDDLVLTRLTALLDGRVGDPPDAGARERDIAEGLRRAAAGEPPGYCDNDKTAGAAGDYLVWAQTVAEARRRGSDVTLVTRDGKEDWWRKARSELLGPRSELVEEFHDLTGHRLHMLLTADLLARSEVLAVDVSERSVEDADRAGDDEPEPAERWTAAAVRELLRRLDQEGWPHASVIRAAAAAGGKVSRKRVFEICGYPEGRMLKGFTRPVARLTSWLKDEGLAPPGVVPMLVPAYGTGVLALAFDIPAEVVGILDGGA